MSRNGRHLDNYLKNLQLQDALSLGYIFLIVLGLIDNVIYWSGLGINIFDYTSITDILITPLNTFFSSPKGSLFLIVFLVGYYYLFKYLYTYLMKYAKAKAEKNNKPFKDIPFQPLTIVIVFFTLVFIGYSAGISTSEKERIQNKQHIANRILTFSDNTTKEVHVVGVNSVYLFYAEIGNSDINIVPIGDNIKNIKKISTKK
jgi:hypothetical protein